MFENSNLHTIKDSNNGKINNYEKLCNVLKTNSALITENGDLFKNKVQELARKMDASLLATLLSDSFTEEMFFVDVNGIKVFDANKFTYMVESQAFLPDSYTRFKQNIMLTDGSHSIRKSNDVVLEFPNKDCVLEFDSTDESDNRDEVFLNEILMKQEIDTLLDHKAFINATRYTANGAKPTTDISMDDNLIIKGNNLLALHTLYPKYKGQIKLMYWDILYNTQNDQVPYNDRFKHSSWLTMMKNRLEIARKLLKEDGVICLQCDDNEMAYLKVLCDEIFGRNNYVNTIAVKAKAMAGASGGGEDKRLKKNFEFILMYSKNYDNFQYKAPVEEKNLMDVIEEHKKDKVGFYYTRIIKNYGTKKLIGAITIGGGKEMQVFEHADFEFSSINDVCKKEGITTEEAYFKYYDDIFMVTNAQTSLLTKVNSFVNEKNKLISYVYTPITGRAKGQLETKFVWNETLVVWLKDTCIKKNNKVLKLEKQGALWNDVSWGRLDLEGSVKLKSGKKPEYLIQRIIEMLTSEGDIILDAYLGSGTTAAVAHKMGRRYIGIEQLDSHSLMEIERMRGVIAGEQTGISQSVNWNGGGSFVFFELAKNSQNILDKIATSNKTEELQAIYDELKTSPFVLYTVDILKMEKEKDAFAALTIDEQKKFLVSVIDKNTLYINYSDIENGNHSLSENDKRFTENFYKED